MAEDRQSNQANPHLWELNVARDLFWILLAAGAIWLVYALRAVFFPVVVAFVLAYLVDPIICRLEGRGFRRVLTVSLLLAAIAVAVLGLGLWLVPLAAGQVSQLVENLPGYLERLLPRMGIQSDELIESLRQYASQSQDIPMKLLPYLWQGAGHTVGVISAVFGTTIYLSMLIVLIPFYFFFFAWRYPDLVAWPKQFIPASRRERTLEIAGKMDRLIGVYFRVRLVIALIMGGMFSFGWMLTGVPYWLLVGMIAGLLSFIPYAAVLGWVLAIALKYLDSIAGGGGDVSLLSVVVWPSVVYGIVQAIEGWGLTPWLQGREMKMSVPTVVLVLFIGGALAGLLGMLLAIPVAACVKVLYDEVVRPALHDWAENG